MLRKGRIYIEHFTPYSPEIFVLELFFSEDGTTLYEKLAVLRTISVGERLTYKHTNSLNARECRVRQKTLSVEEQKHV
jgi:hypothetical protein